MVKIISILNILLAVVMAFVIVKLERQSHTQMHELSTQLMKCWDYENALVQKGFAKFDKDGNIVPLDYYETTH